MNGKCLFTVGAVILFFMTASTVAQTGDKSFARIWGDWIDGMSYEYADLSQFDFQYRYETEKISGGKGRDVRTVSIRKDKDHPFQVLLQMNDLERIRDIRPKPDTENAYLVVLPDAVTLKAGLDTIVLDFNVVCIFDQGRPRRFIFSATEIPKRFPSRALRFIYTWDVATYIHYGEEEAYWVPTAIEIEHLVRVQGRHRLARNHLVKKSWTLRRIENVRRVGIDDIEVIEDIEVID